MPGARAPGRQHSAAADFSLQLKIVAGAGAFVCGEETALMASIEGRRGMPQAAAAVPGAEAGCGASRR